jgi:hypothetical protein
MPKYVVYSYTASSPSLVLSGRAEAESKKEALANVVSEDVGEVETRDFERTGNFVEASGHYVVIREDAIDSFSLK